MAGEATGSTAERGTAAGCGVDDASRMVAHALTRSARRIIVAPSRFMPMSK